MFGARPLTRPVDSGDDFADDSPFDVRESEVASGVTIGEFFVI